MKYCTVSIEIGTDSSTVDSYVTQIERGMVEG